VLAHRATVEEILEEYDGLTREDILACSLFATKSSGDATFMPRWLLEIESGRGAQTRTGGLMVTNYDMLSLTTSLTAAITPTQIGIGIVTFPSEGNR
jgi:hypothetical protein